jgi:hypothetical protein
VRSAVDDRDDVVERGNPMAKALTAFALTYADQNETDRQAFVASVSNATVSNGA